MIWVNSKLVLTNWWFFMSMEWSISTIKSVCISRVLFYLLFKEASDFPLIRWKKINLHNYFTKINYNNPISQYNSEFIVALLLFFLFIFHTFLFFLLLVITFFFIFFLFHHSSHVLSLTLSLILLLLLLVWKRHWGLTLLFCWLRLWSTFQ